MSRIFFDRDLDTAASWWRIHRKDGVTLAFTTHDRDLWFGGVLHRAAPGMMPSAVRKTMSLADDEAEVVGALGHDTIRAEEIAAGRFDEAAIECGIVDWETLENASLYSGTIEGVTQDASGFTAQLTSAKSRLDVDPVPRASPACRARFCGPGCDLSASSYTKRAKVLAVDHEANSIRIDASEPQRYVHGAMRFIDGDQTGFEFTILDERSGELELDAPLAASIAPGQRVKVLEGCDRTIATCAARFGNAINFQGEPHLPGNDLLAQYPQPR